MRSSCIDSIKIRFIQTLGLAQRAGKVVTGDVFWEAFSKGQVKLVLLATDASPRRQREVIQKAESKDIFCLKLFTSHEISQAIGKANRVVIGITDQGFAERLLTYLEEKKG